VSVIDFLLLLELLERLVPDGVSGLEFHVLLARLLELVLQRGREGRHQFKLEPQQQKQQLRFDQQQDGQDEVLVDSAEKVEHAQPQAQDYPLEAVDPADPVAVCPQG